MLTKYGILVLFAAHAHTALSYAVGQVTIQESNAYPPSGQMNSGTHPNTAAIDSRKVLLDDGVFIGALDYRVEKFLGIPFAMPP